MANMSFQQGCPQCGTNTNLLHNLDQGMKLRLEKEGTNVPFDSVCTSCFKALSKNLSNASYLAAEQTIQKNFKSNLWKNRLNLIRHARNLLALKEFAEAAICYEKYLKVLEYIYEKKRHEFTAQMFKDTPREVTLIAGALWALVEVYDMHPKYQEKQEEAARKLGELMSYTNLFASIVKKANVKRRHARNPKAYKMLLQSAHVSSGMCFIASAAFPDRNDPTVKTLRLFRNEVLAKFAFGRWFIRFYYSISPAIAFRLRQRPFALRALRLTLPLLAKFLKRLI